MSRTAKGGVFFALIQIVGLGAGLLTQRVLGEVLTPSGYGTYGLIITFTTIASTLLTSGIPRFASRFIAISKEGAVSISVKIRRIQLQLTALVFVGYIALAPVVARFIAPEGELGVVLLASLMIPVESLNILYYNFLNGLREYHKQGSARIFYFLAKAILMISLVVLGFQVGGAILGFILGSGCSLLVEYISWKRVIQPDVASGRTAGSLLSQALTFSLPLIAYSTLEYLLNNIDLFVLNAFVDRYSVGIYFAAKNISNIPYLVLVGTFAAFFPTLSELYARNDKEEFRHHSAQTLKFLLIIIIPSILFMMTFSDFIVVFVYGSGYSTASVSAMLLSTGFLISTLTVFAVTLMLSTGYSTGTIAVTLLSLVAEVSACSVAVPFYGIEGAALSWIITSLIGLSTVIIILSSIQDVMIPWRSLAKVIASAIPSALLMIVFWNTSPYVGFLTSVCVYAGFLLISKSLTKDEIIYLVKSIL